MTHLDKESPNFLIRLPLKENLLSIFKAQIHTFLNTTFTLKRVKMEQESKVILGLSASKIVQKPNKYFSKTERHQIIQELLSSGCTKQDIWYKYTGQEEEHGQLLRWMRQFGYDDTIITRRPNFATNQFVMPKKKKSGKLLDTSSDSFENLQLKKRITELERQLKDAEMKAIAFSTMVDIAEREFKIPIRKKLNTKL
jgi:transposase